MKIIILGAGPAGLTAGYEAVNKNIKPVVFEKLDDVGGISKTIDYKNFLFDIGGHRFFTKYEEVQKIWEDIMGPDFIKRPRLSRIYYKNKFYYYPLKPLNALGNLGILTSSHVILSYLYSQVNPYKNVTNLEEWVSNKFGKKLFQIFFKTYTEKVWGTSCQEIQADWAAQRIKGLSLIKAVMNSFGLFKKGKLTTLIDEFKYPRKGPGQMWNRAKKIINEKGGEVSLHSKAVQINRSGNEIKSVIIEKKGTKQEISGNHFISSLPLRNLIHAINPPPPDKVIKAANQLKYRDFFTVGLIINKKEIFPDNWIYIHSPDVKVGRIQNFKNWSPEMVPDQDVTTLGLEYFCFDTDEIWNEKDSLLIEMAKKEIEKLNFASRELVKDGTVIRSPKTYPIYDKNYKQNVNIIKNYLSGFKNLQTIGRNGLHRYNNQDHSMLSALYAIRNVLGEKHSVWDINIDEEYHEIKEG